MNLEKLREVYVKNAVVEYRASDKRRWRSALWCWKVVGNYNHGATLGLASDMNVSPDTVEDLAHAYGIFVDLGKLGPTARRYVFACRDMPYIYYSHFRALHDAMKRYNLTIEQVLDLLHDVVQSEGQISSRDVDKQAKGRWGEQEDWTREAEQIQKKLNNLLQRPDLPKVGRGRAKLLYNWIGENVK